MIRKIEAINADENEDECLKRSAKALLKIVQRKKIKQEFNKKTKTAMFSILCDQIKKVLFCVYFDCNQTKC